MFSFFLVLGVVSSSDAFAPYTEHIPGTTVSFDMVPVTGGSFVMGSKSGAKDEAPPHKVEVSSFWMGKFEVTWNEYDLFAFGDWNVFATDAVSQPTPPYVDPTFGLGHEGHPALGITHHAAMEYCKWLSAVTGKTYRLPTEAEWEYAARAHSQSAYFTGNDPSGIADYAWTQDNSNAKPHPVGKKQPNPFGLFDIYGNVREWVQDAYKSDFYASPAAGAPNPSRRPSR